MNYNQFSYYRSNPFHQDGYIPPIAHRNRKKPQYLTEIPQGNEHWDHLGRKHGGFQHSNIQNQGILQSPERFPFQNRIALDKKYERNLNTIDIEGATSSTLMSEAVRNKWRARESLIRRQKQQQVNNPTDELSRFEATQFQKRRAIAMKQIKKNQELAKQFGSRKEYTYDNDHVYERQRSLNGQRNPQAEITEKKSKEMERQILEREKQQRQKYEQKREGQNEQQQRQNEKQREYENQLPRYQSIDAANMNELRQNQRYNSNNYHNQNMQQYQKSGYQSPVLQPKGDHDYSKAPQNRREFRMQNPTNLSSDSKMYLAGKNLMG